MKKKKVLIYIPNLYHGGGAERVSQDLAHALAETYEVSFFTQHKNTNVDAGLKVYSCNQSESSISKLFAMIPTAKKLSDYCKKNDIDIVISHMARANTILMLSNMLFGNKAKTILVTHNANSGRAVHRLWMKLWNYANKNVAVSYGSEFILKQRGIKNTTTIYNAYNIPLIKNKLEKNVLPEHEHLFKDGIVFLNIGRLHKQKGQADLINAFHLVVQEHPTAKLLIAGDGPLRKELSELITLLNLKGNVFLLGNVENVFPYLRAADCFVLSSLWEGLPTVVVEALLSETYIISTDCMSGPREILSTRNYTEDIEYPYLAQHGTLVPNPQKHPRGSFGLLALCMNDFISNPRSQNTAEITEYSYKTICKEWVSLIESI